MPQRKQISWRNLLVGAGMNIFQVTSLGQPMENMKTYVSANRNATLGEAGRALLARGLIRGFYQGLIPWAWLEASTKGAILILTSTEVSYHSTHSFGLGPAVGATLGGVAGGAAQSYLTMGMTTCMKTVEVTRSKTAMAGGKVPGTLETFFGIIRTQGIRGVNKGVNAVALRQITGWASRMGISKAAEIPIRKLRGKSESDKLVIGEKIVASTIGGALSCWNQPFEVIRVDMQAVKATQSATKPTMLSTARLIWQDNGLRGFFRGVVPRIGVASWATICMVGLGDTVRECFAR
ncbi:mitochondrial DNA replication protein [Macroventuria anomochaeta]|uniref:Mitochondrial DNA replication protein n=1 Tax=Macroventuria anomochaeta TaxID=301207 RepID=A0ACB6RQL3_9PLEO|nr:mitochondrial DNA replication protein [Macroventuria anomochaeta]KAF2623199.1 mitochondrial DNA replication protein [Macroventuria anomochaeta]